MSSRALSRIASLIARRTPADLRNSHRFSAARAAWRASISEHLAPICNVAPVVQDEARDTHRTLEVLEAAAHERPELAHFSPLPKGPSSMRARFLMLVVAR